MDVLRIFGVPMDLGQTRRGVDMGPSAVRYAGLQERLETLGYEVHDGGNIEVAQVEEIKDRDETQSVPEEHARCLPEVSHVCERVYQHTVASVDAHERVIFIGGDHSISIGTVAGVAHHAAVGLIWIDAHADINTPGTTPSGNIHGMSVATLLGDGPRELTGIGQPGAKLRPEQVVMIGVRDLDMGEREKIRQSGISVFTMRQIDELGMGTVIRLALERLRQYARLHISLDLDGLDPEVAPGVGTPVPGGLSYREAHLLMEILADSGKVRSMDIVEINPILDDR
ncbi:MAG: arginase, partial [Chloroflexi bacterium]|nr:arginase [Chloroflexota bacterium]